MEKNGGTKKWTATMCCLMLLVVNQAAAVSFQECYGGCFLLCAIIPTNSLFTCTVRCLQDCLIPPSISTTRDSQLLNFCKLGCASYSCSNLSSAHDPREKEVAGCVDSCSEKCTK